MSAIDSLPAHAWLWIFGIAGVAGIVHGMLGLGFPLVATPFLALLTDLRTAIVLTILPSMTVQVVSILRGGNFRRSIARFWPMPLYFACGSFVGTRLLIVSDPAPFTLFLVAIIIAYLNLERLGRLNWGAIARHPQWFAVPFGFAAGFFEGTANASAPPLVIFFLAVGTEPLAMVQAMNLCFLSGKAMQAGTLTWVGGIAPAAWAATLPIALAGAFALAGGMALRSRIDTATYRRWLKLALLVMAVILLAQFFNRMQGRFGV